MTSLHPAEATRLLVEIPEKGGSVVVSTIVGDNQFTGNRIALIVIENEEPELRGSLILESGTDSVMQLMKDILENPRSSDGLHKLTIADQSLEVYIEIRRPVQELVVVGAGHIAQPLAHLGALLGFQVTVIDDRPEFATRERFPSAEKVIRADFSDPFRETPLHTRSHVLLVTRGHKYDYACLIRALQMDPPPAYIGMIGSRRRVRATYVQLLEEGIAHALLDHIHAPVGLDVGAETPEEIAVAVAAELIMVRRGGTGASLKGVERVMERFFKEDK